MPAVRVEVTGAASGLVVTPGTVTIAVGVGVTGAVTADDPSGLVVPGTDTAAEPSGLVAVAGWVTVVSGRWPDDRLGPFEPVCPNWVASGVVVRTIAVPVFVAGTAA
jgi:hypothetical protein